MFHNSFGLKMVMRNRVFNSWLNISSNSSNRLFTTTLLSQKLKEEVHIPRWSSFFPNSKVNPCPRNFRQHGDPIIEQVVLLPAGLLSVLWSSTQHLDVTCGTYWHDHPFLIILKPCNLIRKVWFKSTDRMGKGEGRSYGRPLAYRLSWGNPSRFSTSDPKEKTPVFKPNIW